MRGCPPSRAADHRRRQSQRTCQALAAVEHKIHTTRYDWRDTNTRNDLREALGQLERGPLPSEGTLPEVSKFVGRWTRRRRRRSARRGFRPG